MADGHCRSQFCHISTISSTPQQLMMRCNYLVRWLVRHRLKLGAWIIAENKIDNSINNLLNFTYQEKTRKYDKYFLTEINIAKF